MRLLQALHPRWVLTALAVGLAACRVEEPRPATPPAPAALTGTQERQALALGRQVAAETFSLLSSNLQGALASGGVTNALPFCSVAASPLTASVGARHGATVRRFSHRPRHPAGRATPEEQRVLDQFQAALQSGGSPTPIAVALLPEKATVFAPIVITNALCLKCHGQPDGEIEPPALAVIRQLYPADAAVGFRLGDLRGAWRIDLPLAALREP